MQTTRVQRCSTCVICAQSSSSKSRTSSVTCGFTRGKDRLHATCVTDRLPRYATTETFLYFFCARSLCAHSVCALSRCDYPFGAIHFTGKTRYKRDMQRERERETALVFCSLLCFSRVYLCLTRPIMRCISGFRAQDAQTTAHEGEAVQMQ